MEEIALKINTVRQLDYYKTYPNWVYENNELNNDFSYYLQSAIKQLNNKKITRIYFGTEFCEQYIPAVKDIEKVLEFCRDNELNFTLVTPCIMESNLSKIEDIFKYLSLTEDFNDCEVVFNDLGILELITTKYNNFVPLRGRLMQKKQYDIRVNIEELERLLTNKGIEAYRSSSISNNEIKILKKYNINRIEFDSLNFNISDETNVNFNKSLYIPFGLYTTGHLCMFRNLTLSDDKKFNMDKCVCSRPCKNLFQLMTKQSNLLTQDKLKLYRCGNTIYHLNDIDIDNKTLKKYRIVLQPTLML